MGLIGILNSSQECGFFSYTWPFPVLQNQYKADYDDFMKGIGWLPLGSLEAEKNKKAMEIISEKKYRQHPNTLKYSTLMDSMNMVLAQNNAKIMNEVSLSIMYYIRCIKKNIDIFYILSLGFTMNVLVLRYQN